MSKKFEINQQVWVIRDKSGVSATISAEDPDWTERYVIKFDYDGTEDNYPVGRMFSTRKELVTEAVDALTQSLIGVKEDKEKKLSDFEDAVLACSKAEEQLNEWKNILKNIGD